MTHVNLAGSPALHRGFRRFANASEMLLSELSWALDLDKRNRQKPPTAVQKIARNLLVTATDNPTHR